MKRRSFLKTAANSIILPGMAGSLGLQALGRSSSPLIRALSMVEETNHILVLLFLDGGNDGLNTLVPLDQYDVLKKLRPQVALPENALLSLPGTNLGLHPAMPGFKSLFEENRLQIIHQVGYPNQDFSHFRSTDIWLSGSDSEQVLNSGWAGRYLSQEHPTYPASYPNTQNPYPLAIELGITNSLLFQGLTQNMSYVLQSTDYFYELVGEVSEEPDPTPSGERIELIKLAQRHSQQYGQVVVDAARKVTSQGYFPDNPLAQQLKIVSRLIAGGLDTKLYLVRLDGFDTHSFQVDSSGNTLQGLHAQLLKWVDEAVLAFMQDLERQGQADRVMGMTISEFGRRIVSNASLGTDHGSAAPLFLFGNQVKGGVVGQWQPLNSQMTVEDNLDFQIDMRQVHSSVFDQWLCVPATDLRQIFLRDYSPIGIVKDGTACLTTSADQIDGNEQPGFELYPNPAVDYFVLDFNAKGEPLAFDLFAMDGRWIQNLQRGLSPSGKNKKHIYISALPSGHYQVVCRSGGRVHSRMLTKL